MSVGFTHGMERVKLIDFEDFKRFFESSEDINKDLADMCIEIVSQEALYISGAKWKGHADVPLAILPVLVLACRRLYMNPDRFTRESNGEYSYALDSSVTDASIFTPNEVARLKEIGGRRGNRLSGLGSIRTKKEVIW